ncbi:hypothetical protein MF271_22415 (plasmid) [Deinococcus sp. KNUC1210]|uniref:hypothetical protein n=1 Tax=Deinococcus sp. KNUC1210 TaxID=2917691 RepID=UPI001EF15EB6|nr:hypothetical protein [Deinococcus sp. KNUC1210]ULH18225.1 hypothetical protein MF271_22415 [Deinococcus sp. KNUC1210]
MTTDLEVRGLPQRPASRSGYRALAPMTQMTPAHRRSIVRPLFTLLPLLLVVTSAQAAPALLFSKQSMTSASPCKKYGCTLLRQRANADYETGKVVNTSYEYSLKNTSLRIMVFRDLQNRLISFNASDSDIDPREGRMLTEFITAMTGRPLKKDLYLNCVSGPVGYGTRTDIHIPLDQFGRNGVTVDVSCSLGLDSKEPGSQFGFYVGESGF